MREVQHFSSGSGELISIAAPFKGAPLRDNKRQLRQSVFTVCAGIAKTKLQRQ